MNSQADPKATESPAFISARAAMATAQQAANRPSNEAPALPVAVSGPEGVGVIVFFLSNSGPASSRVEPPDVFVQLDRTGKVLKNEPFAQRKIEAFRTRVAEPGIGSATTLSVEDYIAKRKRFLDISPAVWAAFADGSAPSSLAELVTEYWRLFCAVTRETDAAYYLEASPAFFAWVRSHAK